MAACQGGMLLLALAVAVYAAPPAATSCASSSDCGQREFCLSGTCSCPVLFKGPGCLKTRSPVTKTCLHGFTGWPSKGYSPGGIDFAHCAVVGSSSILKGSKHGKKIDAATAVFRFNEAPTKGHEGDVGHWKSSTIRMQNKERGGFAEKPGERCVVWSTNEYKKSRSNKMCKVTMMSAALENYAKSYFAKFGRKGSTSSQMSKMSNGFLGLVMALHLCGRVDVYGFDQGQGYYFKKFVGVPKGWGANKAIQPSTRPFKERHSWTAERSCMLTLATKLEGVTFYGVKGRILKKKTLSVAASQQPLESAQPGATFSAEPSSRAAPARRSPWLAIRRRWRNADSSVNRTSLAVESGDAGRQIPLPSEMFDRGVKAAASVASMLRELDTT